MAIILDRITAGFADQGSTS